MADDPEDDRSASDLADIERASSSGEEDGQAGTHDPDDKLANDTPDQVEAYEQSYEHGAEEAGN